jgi:hypothetical protein
MLPQEFTLSKHLFEQYKEYVTGIPPEQFNGIEEYIKNPKTSNFWKYDLEKKFKEEYNFYSSHNIFFYGCKFELYTKKYNERLSNYTKGIVDAHEIDFIIKDYNKIAINYLYAFCPNELAEQIEVSLRRQREYLEQKSENFGCKICKSKDRWGIDEYKYSKIIEMKIEEDLIDLSDTITSEKVIYLQQMGVLDFLRNQVSWGVSNNQLASLLSAITGDNPSTLQSYINPINNPSVVQKNNPFNNVNIVSKINSKLIEIGFKIPE